MSATQQSILENLGFRNKRLVAYGAGVGLLQMRAIIFANVPLTILAIAESLNGSGFVWGEHYIDCSLLHFETMATRLWHDYWVPQHDPPHIKPIRRVNQAVRESGAGTGAVGCVSRDYARAARTLA